MKRTELEGRAWVDRFIYADVFVRRKHTAWLSYIWIKCVIITTCGSLFFFLGHFFFLAYFKIVIVYYKSVAL